MPPPAPVTPPAPPVVVPPPMPVADEPSKPEPSEPEPETDEPDDGDATSGDDEGPVHGYLQIEDGERNVLDRPVLFGRRPPETATIDDTEARVVTLAGSDALSRSHAQVRFDGTDVQVVDLGSANHTYVTAPGGDPVRLRENEPFTVEPGSVISLADAVRVTFDTD